MLYLGLLTLLPAWAEEEKEEKEEKEEEEEKTIAEIVEEFTKVEGLFELYQDPKTGSVKMLIEQDHLDEEFIYFVQTMDGVLEASHFRGSYRGSTVIKLNKSFDKIEFIEQNTQYFFDPESALYRAKDANISPSVLAALSIEATDTDEEGKESYLIDADKLFLSETLHQVKPSPNPNFSGNRFSLGSLSEDKTKYNALNNYADNTDLVVTYVYHNAQPTNYGSGAVTNARNVSIRMHHSLIKMPKNDFEPRIDDYRIGYFNQRVTDLTSLDYAPYLDLINRWHLVKKDPKAEISDPEVPIVWWIENTTPIEYRNSVKKGVESWNIAFEKAGFSNAIVVKIQPDDADWNAGDINYNVLRWTSSPRVPFGGYGPSFANPRTGQLLGADIMLELIYVTNRIKYEEIFTSAPTSYQEEAPWILPEQFNQCHFGGHIHDNLMVGMATLTAQGAAEEDISNLIQESIFHLTLHEVGHTLGLNHNMKASQTVSLENLHNVEWAEKNGLVGSVMDYTPINIAPKGATQGKYFSDRPGTYDLWAIEFGYRPDMTEEQRKKILRRSLEPMLTFGNDADDMRSPGKAIDPRVNVGDLSNDVIRWGEQRYQIVDELLVNLQEQFTKEDQSFQSLVYAFSVLLNQKGSAASSVSRYIGGVYVERAAGDQFTDIAPYTPVPEAEQRRAMKMLKNTIFAPDAFQLESTIADHLQTQRRGFSFFGNNEDPKLHSRILWMQQRVLWHVLHPNVLQRMTDSTLYGNTYTVNEMMSDLTKAIFIGDLLGSVNTHRQLLQNAYVDNLIDIVENPNNDYDSIARATAQSNLKKIQALLSVAMMGNSETTAHRDFLRVKINDLWD